MFDGQQKVEATANKTTKRTESTETTTTTETATSTSSTTTTGNETVTINPAVESWSQMLQDGKQQQQQKQKEKQHQQHQPCGFCIAPPVAAGTARSRTNQQGTATAAHAPQQQQQPQQCLQKQVQQLLSAQQIPFLGLPSPSFFFTTSSSRTGTILSQLYHNLAPETTTNTASSSDSTAIINNVVQSSASSSRTTNILSVLYDTIQEKIDTDNVFLHKYDNNIYLNEQQQPQEQPQHQQEQNDQSSCSSSNNSCSTNSSLINSSVSSLSSLRHQGDDGDDDKIDEGKKKESNAASSSSRQTSFRLALSRLKQQPPPPQQQANSQHNQHHPALRTILDNDHEDESEEDTRTPSQIKSEHFHRMGLLVCSLIYTTLFVGAVYGWGPMQLLLEENGAFSYKCQNYSDPDDSSATTTADTKEEEGQLCPDQDATLIRIQLIANVSIIASPLLGMIVDKYQAKSGFLFLTINWWLGLAILIVSSALSPLMMTTITDGTVVYPPGVVHVDRLLFVAFTCLSLGAWMGSLLTVNVGLYFTGQMRERVIFLLNSVFDAGSCVFLGLHALGNPNGRLDLPLWLVASIYEGLAVLILGCGLYFWYSAVPEDEHRAEQKAIDTMITEFSDVVVASSGEISNQPSAANAAAAGAADGGRRADRVMFAQFQRASVAIRPSVAVHQRRNLLASSHLRGSNFHDSSRSFGSISGGGGGRKRRKGRSQSFRLDLPGAYLRSANNSLENISMSSHTSIPQQRQLGSVKVSFGSPQQQQVQLQLPDCFDSTFNNSNTTSSKPRQQLLPEMLETTLEAPDLEESRSSSSPLKNCSPTANQKKENDDGEQKQEEAELRKWERPTISDANISVHMDDRRNSKNCSVSVSSSIDWNHAEKMIKRAADQLKQEVAVSIKQEQRKNHVDIENYVLIADRTPWEQLRSPPFLLTCVFSTIHVASCSWNLVTQRNFLAFLGDDERGNFYLSLFTALLPVSIVAAPFGSNLIEKFGYMGNLHLVNVLGVAYTAVKLFSSDLNVQIVGFTIFTFYRCFLFGTYMSFLPSFLAGKVVGKAIGISLSLSGVFGFIAIPLSDLAIHELNGNFFIPNCFYIAFYPVAFLAVCGMGSYMKLEAAAKDIKQLAKTEKQFNVARKRQSIAKVQCSRNLGMKEEVAV